MSFINFKYVLKKEKKKIKTQKGIQTYKVVHYCVGNSGITVLFFLLSLLTKFLNRNLRAVFASEERGTQRMSFKALRVHVDKSLHYLSSG